MTTLYLHVRFWRNQGMDKNLVVFLHFFESSFYE
jgi:hypothetical protein